MPRPVFTLEVLDAKEGDALLLHWGPKDAPRLMVIDGGPSGVWKRSLSKALEALRAARADPLPIDLVMVSHADGDHIVGILDMTDRMERLEDQGKPPRYVVDDMWFNSFDDIVGNVEIAAFAGGFAMPTDETRDAAATIASVGQGRTLRDRANRLGLRINGGDELIVDGWIWDFGDGLTFDIVGPSQKRLEEFQEKWDAEVKKKGWAVNPASAEVAAYLDESPTNLASTVVVAQVGSKSMLLTGDARGDDILAGLRAAGYIEGSRSMLVDILKIPHHGSDRNVSTNFFKKVRARHYVVSGNGKHDNPDIATLQMILAARGSAKYTIHSTYRKGVDGHEQRLDSFLAGLSAEQRAKFVFRDESEISFSIHLGEPL